MFEKRFADCYARFDGQTLVIGNDCLERAWEMTYARPVVRSLTDKRTGRAWFSADHQSQWEVWPEQRCAFYHKGITEGNMRVLDVEAASDDDLGFAREHLRVAVRLAFDGFEITWLHLIYPGLPVLRQMLRAEATGARTLPDMERAEEWPKDHQDWLPLNTLHAKYKLVSFTDHTDDMENLVQETEGLLTRRNFGSLRGNLLFVRDYTDGAGITLVKEGPVPLGYLPGMDRDFFLKGFNVFPACWGFDADECRGQGVLATYGSALMLWQGEEENAYAALHRYFRARKVFTPHRDAHIMSNTWGDGTADGSICEEFLLNELKRAKELGVTLFQIDDGWEKGVTANSVRTAQEDSVWGEGYYKSNPDFWGVNEQRLPRGLEPIADYAKENGIGLGLWFSPDSMNDFAAWERDAETLLSLHRKYGVKAFKMDGLIFRNKRCEENFGRLMRRVAEGSKGQVFFNLDTTAGVRNGYVGRCQYGNLFVENRFTSKFGKWPNYWPHLTLRNLWKLSRYLPSERLQMEYLNVENHRDLFGDDPLAPAACGNAYALAITLFANPLVWMEMTHLSPENAAETRAMLQKYRPIQAEILGGCVQPIGQEPDGVSWTGFLSATNEKSGYLLLLREWTGHDAFDYRLPGLSLRRLSLQSLLGENSQREVKTDSEGVARFTLSKPHSFALYRYTVTD